MKQKSIYIACIILFFISCTNKSHIKNEQQYQYLIGEKIIIPKNLVPCNATAKYYKPILKQKKIITIVEADCTPCVQELKQWQQLIKKKYSNLSVTYYFIAEGKPDYYFKKIIIKDNDLKIPVYLDPNRKFVALNKIPIILKQHTLVLSRDNTIDFIGSPIFDSTNVERISHIVRN